MTNIVPPHPRNFMWVLCNTTVKSQLSEGAELAANSVLGDALTQAMEKLNDAFLKGTNDPSHPEPPVTDDIDQLRKDFAKGDLPLDWIVKEMGYLASKGSPTKQKPLLGMEMTLCQYHYSSANTKMQTQGNTLNTDVQSESQQAQQDNTNLQSLITLASTGNAAATYAANLMQQTMA